jgi:hypothetical protein
MARVWSESLSTVASRLRVVSRSLVARDGRAHDLQRGVQDHADAPLVPAGCERGLDCPGDVEARRRAERLGAQVDGHDAVHAERAAGSAQVAPAVQVEVAPDDGDAVGVDVAGRRRVARAVAQAADLLPHHTGGQRREQGRVGSRTGGQTVAALRRYDGRQDVVDALRDRAREGAAQLAERRGGGSVLLRPAREHRHRQGDRHRLVGAEHQRRHPVARLEVVATGAPAARDDGDPELLQGGDVAAHGALPHPQLTTQLVGGESWPLLDALQEGEHPPGRARHAGR